MQRQEWTKPPVSKRRVCTVLAHRKLQISTLLCSSKYLGPEAYFDYVSKRYNNPTFLKEL